MNAATSPGAAQQTLFTYCDPNSGISFLVDTGAAISVYPATGLDSKEDSSTSVLVAANGTPIETFGKHFFQVSIGELTVSWPFLLARVTRPILGADFLLHTGFLVDVKHKRLVQPETWDTAQLRPDVGADRVCLLAPPENEYLHWIRNS